MIKPRFTLTALIAVTSLCSIALAQYPRIPHDLQAKTDAQKDLADKRSDEIFAKNLPRIEADAKNGKPYIPSAGKPEDLPQATIPAFPGAQGGGMYSFGGRGGKVYVVTSLEDSGPGTFREALEAAGPRIVVFNVAGVIKLKDRIRVRAPYITIDGATAPGDGVCIAGNTVELENHDSIIRHMRFRRGATDMTDRNDSFGGNPVGNIMIDHVSASWGLDENMSMYRHMYSPPDGSKDLKLPTVNITIQNSIFSEGLNTFNHAFGGTIGGLNSTFHHNLFACNAGRNPSVGMYGDFTFVNNVLFNWVHRSVDGGDHQSFFNIINNYFKPGPATPQGEPISYRLLKPESERNKNVVDHFGKAYVAGNFVEGNEKVTKDNWDGGVQPDVKQTPLDAALAKIKVDEPFKHAPIDIMPAGKAYAYVLDNAGALLPKRDPVDTRVIEMVRTGKPTAKALPGSLDQLEHAGYAKEVIEKIMELIPLGIITDPAEVGGYPNYEGTPRKDSDSDGMPDEWEIKYGLNPNDPSDAAKDLSGDGYTNIEKYMYGLDPTKKVDVKSLQPPLAASAEDKSADKDTAAGTADDKEAEYTKAIDKRADDIIALLDITVAAKSAKVHEIIVAQYRALRDWHDVNDPRLKDKNATDDYKDAVRASLKTVHNKYIAALSEQLTPEQVEKVKDKMVYGKVQVTYNAYVEMVGKLNDEQKAKILDWLKQARDEAMDGGSSGEKDAIFKKYKGKINNYLATQGIDMKQATKEWGERQKKSAASKPTSSHGRLVHAVGGQVRQRHGWDAHARKQNDASSALDSLHTADHVLHGVGPGTRA
jgi:hypothetical protein